MVAATRHRLAVLGWLLVSPLALAAQQAVVSSDVNLRHTPSTTKSAIELLRSGAKVEVLDTSQRSGYYHVRGPDGLDGWVWARNIRLPATTELTISGVGATCDASLWDHVYNPSRLIVKQQCIAVTGTIVDATGGKKEDGVRHEPDGDTHGWLQVDPAFQQLLDPGNMSDEGGNLVFEIVCKFHVTQADAKPACPLGYGSQVQVPAVGAHVRIVGTYVQDTNHGRWMEIHPVTSITIIP